MVAEEGFGKRDWLLRECKWSWIKGERVVLEEEFRESGFKGRHEREIE